VSKQTKPPLNPDTTVIDLKEWRRSYIAGELVLERMASDPQFKARMLDVLDRHLSDPDDRALFGLPRKRPPAI
jgi:hypothetical protein